MSSDFPVKGLEKIREEGDLLQLRFRDESNSLSEINATQLAECLVGLAELTGRMARQGMFEKPTAPEVMIRPIKEGSVVIEAVFEWAINNPEMSYSVTTGAGALMTQAINVLTRGARDQVEDFDYLENGNVKLIWRHGSPDEVPEAVWKELKNTPKKTRKSLSKIMAPLAGEASKLEFRLGSSVEETELIENRSVALELEKSDHQLLASLKSEVEESFEIIDVEATLQAIDFDPNSKWKIIVDGRKRSALIEDGEFLAEVDRGLALRKSDVFKLKIRVDSITENERTRTSWTILKVLGHRRGAYDDNSGEQQ